ncbi:MAG: transposase [Actinobacteria bacterium]|nr:transposase [Actinomycetota bacterium]
MEGDRTLGKGMEKNLNNVLPMPIACHVILLTHNEEPFFTSASNCNNLAYLIFETTILHKYNLFAFCIMPDHVHILCWPGNLLVSHFVDLIRFRFEYVLSKGGHKGLVWQADFKEHHLPNEEIAKATVFIFENPVRNGLVNNAMDYPYSFVYGGKKYRP